MEGHRLVARIAADRLTPRAKAEVAKLLAPEETLESVASWADAIRPQRKESGPWHYINLPVTAPRGDWVPYCPAEGCVLRKTEELIAYLKNGRGSREERAEALKFLVHFIGDLHQPLHSGDRHDRGGNEVPVMVNGAPGNLHYAWDTLLVRALLQKDPAFERDPARTIGRWSRWRMGRGTVAHWVWESHDVARDRAYRTLPPERPAVLGDSYAGAALPAIRKQIQRGGIRLGCLLNEIWP
jgi:hypothetical protein